MPKLPKYDPSFDYLYDYRFDVPTVNPFKTKTPIPKVKFGFQPKVGKFQIPAGKLQEDAALDPIVDWKGSTLESPTKFERVKDKILNFLTPPEENNTIVDKVLGSLNPITSTAEAWNSDPGEITMSMAVNPPGGKAAKAVSKVAKKKKGAQVLNKVIEEAVPPKPNTIFGINRVYQGDPRLPAHYQQQGNTGTNTRLFNALIPDSVLTGGERSKKFTFDIPERPRPITDPRRLLPETTSRFESGRRGILDRSNPFQGDLTPVLATPEIQTQIRGLLPERTTRFESSSRGIRDLNNPFIGDITPIPESPKLPDLEPVPTTKNLLLPGTKLSDLPSTAPNPLFNPRTKDDILGYASDWTRSVRAKLRGSGVYGQKVDDAITAYRTGKDKFAGTLINQYNKLVKGIDKDTFSTKIVPALESGTLTGDSKLDAAITGIREIETNLGNLGESSKLLYKNKAGEALSEFKKRENYFPHIYDKSFWDNETNVLNALKQKHPDVPEELLQQAVSRRAENGGRLILEPDRIKGKLAKKFGADLKSFQHGRELDLPGYRTDPDVFKIHIQDMADRLYSQKYLGDFDIAGKPGSHPFADAYHNLPETLKRDLRVYFERTGDSPPSKGSKGLASAISNAMTALHLSNFGISNPVQLASLPSLSTPKAFAKGMASTVFKRPERLEFGLKSGATVPIHGENIAGFDLNTKLGRAFGIPASETFTRSTAAMTGKYTAEDLASRLMKDPNNGRLRSRLEKLTLTPADEIIKNGGKLTEDQLLTAGNRMSALTQGRVQSIDLPANFTKGPWMGPALAFKKYGFVSPSLILDAAKTSGPLGLLGTTAAYAGLGEVSQSVKDAKRAVVRSILDNDSPSSVLEDLPDEFSDLQEKRGNLSTRLGRNVTGGWMGGTASDIIEGASSGPMGLLDTFTPVPISDLIKLGRAGQNYKNSKTGDTKDLEKFAVKSIPFIGTDLASYYYPPKSKKGNRSVFSKNKSIFKQ